MKQIILILYLIIVFIIYGCSTSRESPERNFILKIRYNNLNYNTHPPSEIFVIFNDTLLNNFKINRSKFSVVPSIAYHLTANGGISVMEYINSVGALGCCDYGDMENGYRLNYQEKT